MAPSGHSSAPRACEESLPSAVKNIVSSGRLEFSFCVVSPFGSRTSAAGCGRDEPLLLQPRVHRREVAGRAR